MKTLESLLDADFDIKTFDYEPIKAEPMPGLDGQDWLKYIDDLNQQIKVARTTPLLNQMVELAKEVMSAATENGKLMNTASKDARSVVFAAREIYKLSPIQPNLELEEWVRVANEFNELNNQLRKNKKFCNYIERMRFWCYIHINKGGKDFIKYMTDEHADEEADLILAAFERLKLKVPNNFELKASNAQDGATIITIKRK